MVLAGGEFTEINNRDSMHDNRSTGGQILVALSHEELILDHGSEFGAHRIHDDGSWNSDSKITSKNMASSLY